MSTTAAESENNQEKKFKEMLEEISPGFEYISENIYSSKDQKKFLEVEKCVCNTVGNNCSTTDCQNVAMSSDCPPSCDVTNCQNQKVTKKENKRMQLYQTENKGHGVRAVEDIEMGQFVVEFMGEVISSAEYARRRKRYLKMGMAHSYACTLDQKHFIDPTKKGNVARMINHSCAPNLKLERWAVHGTPGEMTRLVLISLRPITAGEELSWFYGGGFIGDTPQECMCGSEKCLKWIGGSQDKVAKQNAVTPPMEHPQQNSMKRARSGLSRKASPSSKLYRPGNLSKVTERTMITRHTLALSNMQPSVNPTVDVTSLTKVVKERQPLGDLLLVTSPNQN